MNQRWLAGWVCERCARIEKELESYHQYDTETERQEDSPTLAGVDLRPRREPMRVTIALDNNRLS